MAIDENTQRILRQDRDSLRAILPPMWERPLSKRQLGLLLVLTGSVGFIGVLAIDLLDAGREGGLGPAQSLALGATILVVLVGLSLLPLGDRPA